MLQGALKGQKGDRACTKSIVGSQGQAFKAWCSRHSLHEQLVAANGLLLNVQSSLV